MSRYHIVVDGKTCVFEKENDPRVLRYVTTILNCSHMLDFIYYIALHILYELHIIIVCFQCHLTGQVAAVLGR